MRKFIQDIRHGFRVLLKSPGLTAIAVLALGLGVGVNTAIFSLSDVLLYRPLLVPDLDRLVSVHGVRKGTGAKEAVSLPDVLDWRAGTKTVESIAAVTRMTMNVTGSGEPDWLEAARVSVEFFQALGAQPELGRTFLSAEQEKGRDHVVVLAYSLWASRYAKTPDILSRTVKLDGEE